MAYSILLSQLIATLIHYLCTVALPGLADRSAFLEWVYFANHLHPVFVLYMRHALMFKMAVKLTVICLFDISCNSTQAPYFNTYIVFICIKAAWAHIYPGLKYTTGSIMQQNK